LSESAKSFEYSISKPSESANFSEKLEVVQIDRNDCLVPFDVWSGKEDRKMY
jgi:hypothetical protein